MCNFCCKQAERNKLTLTNLCIFANLIEHRAPPKTQTKGKKLWSFHYGIGKYDQDHGIYFHISGATRSNLNVPLFNSFY